MVEPSLHRPCQARDIPAWDFETEVAIVGFGATGACAAIEAADAGAKVMLFERNSGSGGASGLSGGEIYVGGSGGTEAQRDAGFEDSTEDFIAYLKAAGIEAQSGTPLFRSIGGKGRMLSESGVSRIDVFRMVKRRAKNAGVSGKTCCHTFRATGITAYLSNGGTIEKAQTIAAHESPRTTKLYDRTKDDISLDEVERILI